MAVPIVVAIQIDGLLAAKKTMSGTPSWAPGPYPDEERTTIPLRIDGVSCGLDLVCMGYPLVGQSRFRIMLNADRCLWRIDFVDDEPHINSFNRPSDLEEYSFSEPHYHSWADNRHLCTPATLPIQLENARKMPLGVRTFDSALRWFCAQTNIAQPAPAEIVLPPRRKLF